MNKYILPFILIISVFSSCNLDYAPENVMVDETVYKNENTAESALLGSYTKLNVLIAGAPKDQNYYQNTGLAYLLADIGTPNIKVRNQIASTFLSMENAEYDASQHKNFLYNTWKEGYSAIDYANNVISGITQFGKYNEQKKKEHIAEAKFVRAYAYLTLLQLFGDGALAGNLDGLGLVLRLDPYTGYNPNEVKKRATVSETYSQVIKDLTDAITDLPTQVLPASERIRATQSTAKALLSRVHLYRGTFNNNYEDLTQAATLALEVINTANYSFNQNSNELREQLFPLNISDGSTEPNPTVYSNELIFFQPSRISTRKYPNGLNYYYQKKLFSVHPEFVNSFQDNDLRGYVKGSSKSLIQYGDPSSYESDFTSIKYDNINGFNDVIYIRLSEMKLTYAEALTRSTNNITNDALKHLNDIRSRAFIEGKKPDAYQIKDFSSVNDFIDKVLEQRNRELAFEGHYRWDLIRTNRPLLNTQIPNNKKNLPIPNYEIRISNGLIEQNSGFK